MYGLTEQRLEQQALTELWRALGEDYARYGLDPGPGPDCLQEGHRSERYQRNGVTESHDRFVRKWLKLRYNALRRERKVADNFSPASVKIIDVSVCPVTLTPLTHGDKRETNWSVERLNNDLAYALGNVAVVSTLANDAKHTKTLQDVQELARSQTKCDGLTPHEWARFEALMYGPCQHGNPAPYPVRQLVPYFPWVIHETGQEWQDFFVKIATTGTAEERSQFHWAITDGSIRGASQELVRAIVTRLPILATPYDVWADDEVFALLVNWFAVLAARGIDARVTLRELYPAFSIDGRREADLSFASRGHLFAVPQDKSDRAKFFASRRKHGLPVPRK